jgi:hypothetical protein
LDAATSLRERLSSTAQNMLSLVSSLNLSRRLSGRSHAKPESQWTKPDRESTSASNQSGVLSLRGSVFRDRGNLLLIRHPCFVVILNSIQDLVFIFSFHIILLAA